MSTNVLDTISDNEPKRPVFLSVLCVLTFIGSGIGFFNSLMGMVGTSLLDLFTPIGDMFAQILAFLAASFCLFGAFQMWHLKKIGFWLYLLGALLSSVGVLLHASSFSASMNNLNTKLERVDGFLSATGSAVTSISTEVMWLYAILLSVLNTGCVILYVVNKHALVK